MMTTFLISMAWKSAVIAAAGLGLAQILAWLVRGHSAAARVAVLRLTAVMVLTLPLLAVGLPALRIEAGARPVTTAVAAPVTAYAASSAIPARAVAPRFDWRLAVAGVYAAGAGLLLTRLLADIAALALLTHAARPVSDPSWRQALQRAGARARLLVSPHITAPLSWGLKPVILLNPGALDRPQDADAVLAHEAGHIERRDWLFLVLARVTTAVFWFNPLVWWLHRELDQRSEEAVDAYAVARIDRTAYASALIGFAGTTTPRAANGMAHGGQKPGGLSRRIRLILDPRTVRAAPVVTALAGLACIAIATPLAAVELVRPHAQTTTGDVTITAAPVAPPAPAADMIPGRSVTLTREGEPDAADMLQAKLDAEQAQRDEDQAQRDAEQAQRDEDQALRDQQQAKRDEEQAARDQQMAGLNQSDRAMVEQAKAMAEQARSQAGRDQLAAADQMDAGVVQMHQGAGEMRETAVNLRDPAFRQKQIAEAKARGDTLTDERLLAMIPELESQAAELDQQAENLQAQAARMRQNKG